MKSFFVLFLLLVILVNATSIVRVKTFQQLNAFAPWGKTAMGVVEESINAFIEETIKDPNFYVCNVQYEKYKGDVSAMVSVCQKEQ